MTSLKHQMHNTSFCDSGKTSADVIILYKLDNKPKILYIICRLNSKTKNTHCNRKYIHNPNKHIHILDLPIACMLH